MAMLQFNLLPDVKLAYIKAERQKQIVLSISVIVSIASIVLFVLMFSFANVVQKGSISDLTTDISTENEELMKTKDLTKILTVQNQLNSLSTLHGDKVVGSRLFGYIQQVTPGGITISQLDTDYTASTISITGNAPSLAAVNTYADALKFTKYTTKNNETPTASFSEVVLSSFTVAEDEDPKYTITAKFDPILFSQKEDVTLAVPSMVTTRSAVERPGALFQSGGN